MKRNYIYFLLFFFMSTMVSYAQYAWHQKANFGGGVREGAACFSIGNKGYFSCGYDWSSTYKDLWEYDQASDTWTQKSSMPLVLRRYGIGFSIGTKGYVGSGQSNSGFTVDFWEYDQATNSWTQKADIPGPPTYGAVGFSVGSKGYFGTGNIGSATGPYRNDFYEYNPTTNVWSPKATFPGGARYGAFGLGSSSKGYLGFGLDQSMSTILYNDWWEYNPVNDAWTAKSNYPSGARTYLGGFVINGNLFVGTGNGFTPYNDFYKFDPLSNSWSAIANFPGNARYLSSYFSIGNIGYLGIGYDFSGDVDDFYEYAPSGLAPIVALQSSDTSWCDKMAIDFFDLSTNNPISWQWFFPGATPDTSTMQNPTGIYYNAYGNYDVKLIACNATACDSITLLSFIHEFPAPTPPIITQSGDTLFSSTATTYAWYDLNNLSNILSTNQFFVIPQPGSYFVLVTDINGCEEPSATWVVQAQDDFGNDNEFLSVAPNPSNGNFIITFNGNLKERVSYNLYNPLGQLIESSFLEELISKFNLEINSNGIFILEIRIKDRVIRAKLIVNQF